MTARFHFPAPIPANAAGGTLELPAALAHHALRVLRLRENADIVLFDGSGSEYAAQLSIDGRRCWARLGELSAPQRESPLQLVLVQALASGDKMDWVVQKAVELGVSAIIPVQAERSVLRLQSERAAKRVLHWQQIAISACEQSGRNHLPAIAPVQSLAACLAALSGAPAYVLAPGAPALALADKPIVNAATPLHLFIGPEGGWSEAELQACQQAGCRPLGLGPRVLRTETAGLAALAVLQAVWGDMTERT